MRLRLLLSLFLCLASRTWAEATAPVEAAPPAPSGSAPAAIAETTPAPRTYTPPSRHEIGNARAQVSISDWRASIGSMALKDLKPLPLPPWRGVPGRDEESVEAAAHLKVLDTINPTNRSLGYSATDMHNLLHGMGLRLDRRSDGKYGPVEDVWSRVDADAQSITLAHADAATGLDYQISYRMDEQRPTVHCTVRVVNTSAQALELLPTLVAINGVHQDDPGYESYDLAAVAGFGGAPAGFWYASTPTSADLVIAHPDTDQPLLDPAQVDFIGLKSRFFTAFWKPGSFAVTQPASPDQTAAVRLDLNSNGEQGTGPAAGGGEYRIRATCRPYVRRYPAGEEPQAAVEIAFLPTTGNAFTLAPGGTLTASWSLTVSSLRDEHLALLTPAEQQIQYADWYYRFFKMLVKPMEWLLSLLASALHITGLAVIVLVILVKGALHRLNYKAQSSMAKMQKLGPQLKALQDRYGHDRQQAAMKQMELFKKEGVNPVGGCLPILLQMPVFIALYQAFRHSADLRGQGFLWVRDLTLPDQVLHLFDLGGFSFTINPLPLLYIAVMLFISIRTKLPAGAQMNEQAVMMQKMMRWLPVVFGVIFYNMPAGLVLYFVCSAIIGSMEMAWIRKKLGMNVAPTMPVM